MQVYDVRDRCTENMKSQISLLHMTGVCSQALRVQAEGQRNVPRTR